MVSLGDLRVNKKSITQQGDRLLGDLCVNKNSVTQQGDRPLGLLQEVIVD